MPCRFEMDMLSQVYSHSENMNWYAKPASAVQRTMELLNLTGDSKIESFLEWEMILGATM